MKKILNNPWGIAGLSVIGAALIVWRVVMPLMGSEASMGDMLSLPEDDWLGAETSIEAERHTLTSVDAPDVNWNPAPTRDPFALSPSATKTVAKTRTSQSYRPTLDALVSGSRSRLAIIDGQVVVKGDRVADFLVTHIGEQGVRLFNELDGSHSLITVRSR